MKIRRQSSNESSVEEILDNSTVAAVRKVRDDGDRALQHGQVVAVRHGGFRHGARGQDVNVIRITDLEGVVNFSDGSSTRKILKTKKKILKKWKNHEKNSNSKPSRKNFITKSNLHGIIIQKWSYGKFCREWARKWEAKVEKSTKEKEKNLPK